MRVRMAMFDDGVELLEAAAAGTVGWCGGVGT